MGLTASIKELEGAINNLTDNGRWLALEHVKALLENGYAKTPKESVTWTGYYRGIEKEGNIIFPEWARTFDNKSGAATARAPETPKPLKSKEKKTVVIEVMPGEPLPEGYCDYRLFLQRDGLILFAWEIYGNEIKIVWLASNGAMRKYQTQINDESELSTACPKYKFSNGLRFYSNEEPEFIIYAAPPGLTANTRGAFISRLTAAGALVNFNYKFSLGKQETEREMTVFDKINDRKHLSVEETELLEAYRQLNDEGKTELIKHMESLLNEQKAIIKNDKEEVTA